MPIACDISGLSLIPLPLPPPSNATISAYDHLLSNIAEVRSAYLMPGLILGAVDTPTHMLFVGLARLTDANAVREALGAQLGHGNWEHEAYPFMPVVEGTPFFDGISRIGIRVGCRMRKLLRFHWQGFDGTIPSVPQPSAEWVSTARSLSDLFDVDVAREGDNLIVPDGYAVRTYTPTDIILPNDNLPIVVFKE